MKILVITGSPRKAGNTMRMAEAFSEGAAAAGHSVTRFDAALSNLSGCQACMACQNNGGKCIQEDDMSNLYPTILEADAIALATPLYYYGMSAQLKCALDRLFAVNARLMERPKKIALLAACADPGVSSMSALVVQYRILYEYLHWQSVGEVLATGAWERGSVDAQTLERARALAMAL